MQEPNQQSGDWEDRQTDLRGPRKDQEPRSTPVAARKPSAKRKLTPARIGTLWTRLRHTIRDFCRLQANGCPLCTMYGNSIQFQLSQDCDVVELTLKGNQVWKKIRGRRERIKLMKLKTGSAAFELHQMRYSPTRFVIEIIREARKSAPKKS